jgi:hypothetical protein
LAATGILLAGVAPARADALKEAVYILGVHIGNANGVLYSLNNSYDRSKTAHPGAEPLLERQITLTKDLAKALGLQTDYLTKLGADLPKLSFAQMQVRFDSATERLKEAVANRYKKSSGSIFHLGATIAKAGGVAKHIASLNPKDQEAQRPALMTWASYVAGSVVERRLDTGEGVSNGPADDFVRKSFNGPISEAVSAADVAVSTWQSNFEAAPAWSFGPEAPFQPQVKNPPPVKPLPATVFHQSGVKGHPSSASGNPQAGSSAAAPKHSAAAGTGFAGTWSTNWGDMTLTGSGGSISGTYSHSQGSLQGTVEGNVLRFHWSQKGNGNKGAGKFTLSADGRSFTGSWNYNDDPDKAGSSWTGTRK